MRATGFQGNGQIRIARAGERICLRFLGATTQRAVLKKRLLQVVRQDLRDLRAAYGDFAVRIWVTRTADGPPRRRGAIDLDNIAKACLDALTGTLWVDDRQVARLTVERLEGESDAITLLAEPLDPAGLSAAAARLEVVLEEFGAR